MSSATFSSEIRPDPILRGIVLGSGLVFAILGAITIALMPLSLALRTPAIVAWMALAVFEWRLARNAYRNSRCYRLYADGSIDIITADGGRRAAVYAAGSVILPGAAWLKVRAVDGRSWGELIAGNTRESKDWRRFQVICRHVAAC